MKRLFAAVLVLCLLLTMTLTVYAAPEEEEAPTDETVEETPEEVPEETPDTPAAPEAPAEPGGVDPLANETAIRRAEITGIVDEKGTATVSLTLKMQIIGVLEEIRFAVPEDSKNREINGYKAKTKTEKGITYLTVTSNAGFSGEQTFAIT